MKRVSSVSFDIVVSGRRSVTTFLRQEKIAGLLADPQPLGAFLCALAGVASVPPASTTPAQPPESAAGSWGWGTSPDEIKGREDDREAAIEGAREAAEDGATVYIWSTLRDVDPADYLPSAEDLIEHMTEKSYHDQPESMQSEPWPVVDAEARADLTKLLEPINAWARKHAQPWWVADGEPEEVPPSTPTSYHVCLKCADGRESKPIGGLSRDGICAECGVAIRIPEKSRLVRAS